MKRARVIDFALASLAGVATFVAYLADQASVECSQGKQETMAIRIIEGQLINEGDEDAHGACFYDGTTNEAFGPIMRDGDEAEGFLQFISGAGVDPRSYSVHEFRDELARYRAQEGG